MLCKICLVIQILNLIFFTHLIEVVFVMVLFWSFKNKNEK